MKRILTHISNIFAFYPQPYAAKVFKTWVAILVKNRFVGVVSSGQVRIVGFNVTYGNRGSLYGMFKEIFLEQNYLIAPTKERIKIIDCGSNIGVSILYFKFLAPNAEIISFEPNPHTFALLKQNVESNNFSVDLHNAGVAKEAGELTIYTDKDDMSSQSASATKHLTNKQRPLEPVQVKMVTLSSFITGSVDVLKLDIEGAEGEVLEELAAANKLSFVKKLFIEYHFDGQNTIYPLGRMLTTLDEAGYRYVTETGITFPYVIGTTKKNYSSKIIAWR
jgi:FkbM family methyltransferase